jgi:K(+)-stimulated pyrophosphate-energized sodium pump
VFIAILALLVIVSAVYISKRRGIVMGDEEENEEGVAKSADPAVVS